MSKGTVNKVMLIGRLGADPEVRYVPSGSAVANFNLATNRSFKDKEGKIQDQTEWHRIVAWSRLAEFAKQYLRKGMRVYIEGRLQYRDWQDQNGTKRNATDIIANDIQMLESGGKGGPKAEPPDVPDILEDTGGGTEDDSVPF
jgi:single-strand DNA-binding protein